jgi:hypothetical protein
MILQIVAKQPNRESVSNKTTSTKADTTGNTQGLIRKPRVYVQGPLLTSIAMSIAVEITIKSPKIRWIYVSTDNEKMKSLGNIFTIFDWFQ